MWIRTMRSWTTSGGWQGPRALLIGVLVLATGAVSPGAAGGAIPEPPRREQLVRFLAATLPAHPSHPRRGVVGEIRLSFVERPDRGGMIVTFARGEGSFSRRTQGAILLAIDRAARLAGLSSNGWSVELAVNRPEAVVHGDSLTAMVALSIVALAKGDMVQANRVVTGTVTPNGTLGAVSALPFKVEAAHRNRLQRVVLPDEQDIVDPDWRTPFMMHVSPVHSVRRAYEVLTGAPLADQETGERKP